MEKRRAIRRLIRAKPTLEGAGVHLKRVFGFGHVPHFDPFLLLDDFRSDDPRKFQGGFPWHPHRGIETITYVLRGRVAHGDSLGHQGTIAEGDVQWMTAGSGIIHQEMPEGDGSGVLWGFQLWANLPMSHKMIAPRYREIKSSHIPEITTDNKCKIKLIAGKLGESEGPVRDVIINPEYMDIFVPPQTKFQLPTAKERTIIAYVIEGEGDFGGEKDPFADDTSLVLFADGDYILVSTDKKPLRFLLLSGTPLDEPVAWRGPIVMNTQEELQSAFQEYRQGTFLQHKND